MQNKPAQILVDQRMPRRADASNAAFRHPRFREVFASVKAQTGAEGFLGSDGARWYFQRIGDPTPYSVAIPCGDLSPSQIDSLIATSYNLHVQEGEALTPAKAAKLPRSTRAELCHLLEKLGGSDLYSQAQAREAFALVLA